MADIEMGDDLRQMKRATDELIPTRLASFPSGEYPALSTLANKVHWGRNHDTEEADFHIATAARTPFHTKTLTLDAEFPIHLYLSKI